MPAAQKAMMAIQSVGTSYCVIFRAVVSKYPPAEPGALSLEPLEAAGWGR
jgi:hypothetical protein